MAAALVIMGNSHYIATHCTVSAISGAFPGVGQLKTVFMKNPIISFCSFFLVLFFFAGFSEGSSKTEDPLLGSWVFSINQAPWEYSRGIVHFEVNDENELTGKILFSSNTELKIATITREKNKVTFGINIEGMHVTTVVTLEENTIKGYVSTYDGDIPFTAKRKIPD
jgi:hypothetical protein